MSEVKYVYVRLDVQDGEREHTHHCLLITKCENLHFAVQRYASTYWGEGSRDRDCWYFDDGSVAVSVYTYKELTAEEYNTMFDIMY